MKKIQEKQREKRACELQQQEEMQADDGDEDWYIEQKHAEVIKITKEKYN